MCLYCPARTVATGMLGLDSAAAEEGLSKVVDVNSRYRSMLTKLKLLIASTPTNLDLYTIVCNYIAELKSNGLTRNYISDAGYWSASVLLYCKKPWCV